MDRIISNQKKKNLSRKAVRLTGAKYALPQDVISLLENIFIFAS